MSAFPIPFSHPSSQALSTGILFPHPSTQVLSVSTLFKHLSTQVLSVSTLFKHLSTQALSVTPLRLLYCSNIENSADLHSRRPYFFCRPSLSVSIFLLPTFTVGTNFGLPRSVMCLSFPTVTVVSNVSPSPFAVEVRAGNARSDLGSGNDSSFFDIDLHCLSNCLCNAFQSQCRRTINPVEPLLLHLLESKSELAMPGRIWAAGMTAVSLT